MAESKSDPSAHSLSADEELKASNSIEQAKEVHTKAILQTDKSRHHHKETHGKRNDIDENSLIDEVRAPNVFERVKEEIEALVQTIHPKKESPIYERRDEIAVAESEKEKPKSQSDNTVKASKAFERAKGEIEKMLHIERSHHQQKETHGKRDDIGEDTPLNEVRAPNVFERAVEEYEAFVQTIHCKKESQTCEKRDETANATSTQRKTVPLSEDEVEIGAIMHHDKPPNWHQKETHGRSESINEKTPINEVKGPNIFERAKEEIEALVHTIHHKKESNSPGKEGFGSKLGRRLEKVCSPLKDE